jgi:hypothetical protein
MNFLANQSVPSMLSKVLNSHHPRHLNCFFYLSFFPLCVSPNFLLGQSNFQFVGCSMIIVCGLLAL